MTNTLLKLIREERITPETDLLKDLLAKDGSEQVEKSILKLMKTQSADIQEKLSYCLSLAIYESVLPESMSRWYSLLRGNNRAIAMNAWWGKPSSDDVGKMAVQICLKATKSKSAKVRSNAIKTLMNQAAWKSDISPCIDHTPGWAADPEAEVRQSTMCLIGNLAKKSRHDLTTANKAAIECLKDPVPYVVRYAIFAISHLAKRYDIKPGIQKLIQAVCSVNEDGSELRDARRAILNFAKRDKDNHAYCVQMVQSSCVAVDIEKERLMKELNKISV
jgi:hypothetical protein